MTAELEAGRRWWSDSWAAWEPDPTWPVPRLPRGWERAVTDAVWRDVHRGRVWRAQACRIVEDSSELHRALDAPRARRRCCRSTSTARASGFPATAGSSSQRSRATTLSVSRGPVARTRSIRLWRDGAFAYWYVNFEQPLRRTPVGFDTFDEKLDLIVQPDGSYGWKDEDELEQAAALGLLDAGAVRAEAKRVLDEWPFPTGWEDWRPDPSWPIPQLPDGWERV